MTPIDNRNAGIKASGSNMMLTTENRLMFSPEQLGHTPTWRRHDLKILIPLTVAAN